MRAFAAASVVVAVMAAVMAGCHKPEQVVEPIPRAKKNYEAQLPPGALALRKITDPRQIPDFTRACGDTAGVRDAVANSLNYLAKPSSRANFPYGEVTHEQAAASLRAFAALLDSGRSPSDLAAALREQFDVYISVGCDYAGTVLFTAYYTPIFDGSPVRTERFRWPLYGPPADLVKGPDGSPVSPMPDRRTIELQNLYAGQELAWLADPFEAYVAQVQGSAKLRMPDGSLATVGYTANNGHDYRSVRAELVKDGRIGPRDGLPAMLAYFKARPEQVTEYTWRNPRYVFFAPVEDGRPRGCLNEPVTAYRTIATDKRIYPAACLAFLSTTMPERRGGTIVDAPLSGFALDQDAGGAIRAAGRCDLYVGVGPEAGELAGRAQNEGRLYYLFLKPSLIPPGTLAPAAP
ncbi:MAG: murein transglycosylase [Planctomycetes bacterium]|nr:murein transglycosylase [Planctomycetota bacterium]